VTLLPLTCVTRYQDEPAFAFGQTVLQEPPAIVATTATVAPAASRTLIVARVDVLVRRFTPSQAGAIVVVGEGVVVVVGGAVGAAVAGGGGAVAVVVAGLRTPLAAYRYVTP
jgi:hypothetical protein